MIDRTVLHSYISRQQPACMQSAHGDRQRHRRNQTDTEQRQADARARRCKHSGRVSAERVRVWLNKLDECSPEKEGQRMRVSEESRGKSIKSSP